MSEQESQEIKGLNKCPNCFADLNPTDPVCETCGFDTLAGQGMPPSGVDETGQESKSA